MAKKLTEEEWREARRRSEQFEAERRERLRKVLSEASMPLSEKDIQSLTRIQARDFDYIVRGHPGYELAQKRASYRTSFSIMELCHKDLMAALDDFSVKATEKGSDLLGPLGQKALQAIELRIQKELFAITGAAHSLVDHARIVGDAAGIAGRDLKIAECFGADRLHNFIKKLRNLLYHVHSVEAGWTVNFGFDDGSKVASFRFPKDEILRVVARHYDGGKRKELEAFINRWPNDIHLRPLFEEYRKRILRYYAWFDAQLASEDIVALRDYDRVMLERRKHEIRNAWKMLLMFGLKTKVPVDPHNHLPKHLPPTAIEEINKLPKNSREQADLVIKLIDNENAITDELRAQVYELFDRASGVPEKPPKTENGEN